MYPVTHECAISARGSGMYTLSLRKHEVVTAVMRESTDLIRIIIVKTV